MAVRDRFAQSQRYFYVWVRTMNGSMLGIAREFFTLQDAMGYRFVLLSRSQTFRCERVLPQADIKGPSFSAKISPDMEKPYAHTSSALARLRLRGVGGADGCNQRS